MWDFFQQFTLDCKPNSANNFFRQENDIQVFPNPTNKNLIIQTSVPRDIIKVSVFNEQGQKILSVTNQTEIDLSSLENGLVLIKIEIDNRLKIIVVR